jgi:hypothetical protein
MPPPADPIYHPLHREAVLIHSVDASYQITGRPIDVIPIDSASTRSPCPDQSGAFFFRPLDQKTPFESYRAEIILSFL